MALYIFRWLNYNRPCIFNQLNTSAWHLASSAVNQTKSDNQIRQQSPRDNIFNLSSSSLPLRRSIGVCCPDELSDLRAGGLAGDLPATAPREESNEAILKVTRAENRGP